jgi:hypothetical protein
MSAMINATSPTAPQQFKPSNLRDGDEQPIQNKGLVSDNCRYRANTNVQKSVRQPRPDPRSVRNLKSTIKRLLDADEVRHIARIAVCWLIRRVAVARLVRALVRAFTCIRKTIRSVAPAIAGLIAPWSVTSTPVLLLPATCPAPAFDRAKAAAPLAEKAKLMAMCQELSNTGTDKPRSPVYPTKDEIMLLKVPASKDCLQHEPSPVAPTPVLTAEPVRFWAGRSDTPGLTDTIDTKATANTLAAARKANSPFLTDGARVRSGARA